jgi:hypothetical protein
VGVQQEEEFSSLEEVRDWVRDTPPAGAVAAKDIPQAATPKPANHATPQEMVGQQVQKKAPPSAGPRGSRPQRAVAQNVDYTDDINNAEDTSNHWGGNQMKNTAGGMVGEKKKKWQQAAQILVGVKVVKHFSGFGGFPGVVGMAHFPFFRIQYDDGDNEDVDLRELRRILQESSSDVDFGKISILEKLAKGYGGNSAGSFGETKPRQRAAHIGPKSSKYIGVTRKGRSDLIDWRAQIIIDGRCIDLGGHTTPKRRLLKPTMSTQLASG